MSFGGGSPAPPPVLTQPPKETATDPEVQRAIERERELARRRRGRRTTILTSAEGVGEGQQGLKKELG
jgi:hypothetical protein